MVSCTSLTEFYENVTGTSLPARAGLGHFNIFRIEDLSLGHSAPNIPGRREYFKVSLVEGHSLLHYANSVREIDGTTLLFTHPRISYAWEPVSKIQSGYVSIFTADFLAPLANPDDFYVFRNPDISLFPLNEKDATLFKALFARMEATVHGTYAYRYDLLRALLLEAIHLAQQRTPATASRYQGSVAQERLLTRFAELLEQQYDLITPEHPSRLIQPAHFADALGVSINHLNKVARQATGKTTSQLIADRLFQEASLLLKSTHLTINEIAWSLGFDEPNRFSRFFRARTGHPPSTYRHLQMD